jgi:hypothetical protein
MMRTSFPLSFNLRSRFMAAAETFAREAIALVDALSSPNKIIDKVEEMDRLHREANAIEASDPARAAQLRARASLILLR